MACRAPSLCWCTHRPTARVTPSGRSSVRAPSFGTMSSQGTYGSAVATKTVSSWVPASCIAQNAWRKFFGAARNSFRPAPSSAARRASLDSPGLVKLSMYPATTLSAASGRSQSAVTPSAYPSISVVDTVQAKRRPPLPGTGWTCNPASPGRCAASSRRRNRRGGGRSARDRRAAQVHLASHRAGGPPITREPSRYRTPARRAIDRAEMKRCRRRVTRVACDGDRGTRGAIRGELA